MLTEDDAKNRFDSARIVRESFVQQVRYHETIDSTNDDALEFCRNNPCPVPLLVVTSRQTAGRGRSSNQWWSTTGALTCSLVIRPDDFGIAEREWPKASLTTGLSICLALDTLAGEQEVSLKWPNDVWMNRRKICGILIEVGGRRPAPTLVIGIGINVNNSFSGAPDELREIATSLVDTTGTVFDLTEVLGIGTPAGAFARRRSAAGRGVAGAVCVAGPVYRIGIGAREIRGYLPGNRRGWSYNVANAGGSGAVFWRDDHPNSLNLR